MAWCTDNFSVILQYISQYNNNVNRSSNIAYDHTFIFPVVTAINNVLKRQNVHNLGLLDDISLDITAIHSRRFLAHSGTERQLF